MKGLLRRFRFSARTADEVARDVRDEFTFHLEMRAADLVREGHTPASARAQARREFGDMAGADAHGRRRGAQVERRRWMRRLASEFRQDVAYGCRLATRTRGFSIVAVLTLAVSIGANTAVFSILDTLFLKPAPLGDPDTLARVYPGESQVAWANYQDLRERNDVFSDMAAFRSITMSSGEGRLSGEAVTPNYFTVLGVDAAMGRTLLPGDERRGLVVLSDRVWRSRYGSDPSVVGRTLGLDDRTYEIAGVMPPAFRGLAPAGLVRDVWIPVDPDRGGRRFTDRAATDFTVVGRLKPGVTRAGAAASLQVIAAGMHADHPDVPDAFTAMRVIGVDGLDAFQGIGGALVPVFGFVGLMGLAAGFVLLIGCANLAGLLLSRAAARRREIAVRLALGASRGRLVRQLLTESLVLALIGGALGIVLAAWLSASVNGLLDGLPFSFELDLSLDYRIVGYAIGLSFVTALVFGLSPARRAARIDLVPSLRDEATAPGRQRLRSAILVAQVAICSLLLVWGGLFARSLLEARQVDPGFDPTGVLVADVDLGEQPRTAAEQDAVLVALQERAAALPGVESAGDGLGRAAGADVQRALWRLHRGRREARQRAARRRKPHLAGVARDRADPARRRT